ncbi:hypothetical protein NEIRO03_1571 [Nematocida sp. AWRm78]|nr:hypothetical protein NEIRO02_0686 [Nematocida sp. AWRm79]KAI5184114.1 hypothetical protein NEIRO03_1571 [Nematocida sp. AWRm78]
MLSTITYTNSSIIILNEKVLNIYKSGEHSQIQLQSRGVLVYDKYAITENKDILEIHNNTVEVIGKTHKIPTKITVDNGSMYIADKSGSVYRLESLENLSKNPSECIPTHLFGSISMITDIIVKDGLVITADKDNKIRITEGQYPHRIQKFIQVHSKPLISMAIAGEYLVSGGYDWYVSLYNFKSKKTFIFDLITHKTQDLGDIFPGVDTPESISNINLECESRVKKILAYGETVVILKAESLLLTDLSKLTNDGDIPCAEMPSLSGKPFVDGMSMKEGYSVLDEEGTLFTFSPENPVLMKILQVPNYTHKIDISIANKYLE